MSMTRIMMAYRKRVFVLICIYLSTNLFYIFPAQSEEVGTAVKQGLFSLGKNHDVYIGSITINDFWLLNDASRYLDTFLREFNIVTPENHLKFRHTQPQRGVFSFSAADQHVQFAEQHGIAVHGHTLLWHLSNPKWLANSAFKRSDMLDIMNRHIDTVVGRYKGRIEIWDVINEPIKSDGMFRNGVWHDRIGEEYIELALRRARHADPNAKLLINDYDIATLNRKSTGLYNLAKQLLEQGVPLDGIGYQMHLKLQKGIDLDSLSENLQRFADLGLELYVTELDIAIPKPVTATTLQQQAQMYRDIFNRLLSQKAVKSIQMWGFTDKYSWIENHFPGYCCGLLFDKNLKGKLAYTAVVDALSNRTKHFSPTVTLPAGSFDAANGVDTNGAIIFNVDNGDWIRFKDVDIQKGFDTLRVRYGNGQFQPDNWKVEVRLDSPSGVKISEFPIVQTGGWEVFTDKAATVTVGSGRHTIYFVFKGGSGVGHFDWFRFERLKTAASPLTPPSDRQ